MPVGMEEHTQQDPLRGSWRKLLVVGVAVTGEDLPLVVAQPQLRQAATQVLAPLGLADVQTVARQDELQCRQQRLACPRSANPETSGPARCRRRGQRTQSHSPPRAAPPSRRPHPRELCCRAVINRAHRLRTISTPLTQLPGPIGRTSKARRPDRQCRQLSLDSPRPDPLKSVNNNGRSTRARGLSSRHRHAADRVGGYPILQRARR